MFILLSWAVFEEYVIFVTRLFIRLDVLGMQVLHSVASAAAAAGAIAGLSNDVFKIRR